MTFSEEIKAQAVTLGFDACGICRATDSGEEERYMQWLRDHCHGDMGYLERNIEKRLDPRLLVEGARSVISVALNYYPHRTLPAGVPQFAFYAYGRDYHQVVREKLHLLFDWIRQRCPAVTGRSFSDSAPVLERFWAAQAGLGFIGKNTLLILPGKGSFFFLGELIIDLELDYDQPVTQHCGSCRRCLDACPTRALDMPYRLNARQCISYQTIENRGTIDPAIVPLLSNNVYGCDICQKVCPWNHCSRPHTTPDFTPSEAFLSLDLAQLTAMDEERWRNLFRHSAVKRSRFTGLKRNAEAISKTRNK
ncbi:MAG: tRNA epoxyqueuosine(34) reductase QueG [Proteiniphilum sp.]|nr:tRNA epoxyqueuosine(34) reductase QueG [Proteiniphilum sp.]MDD4800768.1 tRNA epoxyqueuosine(34) reductase QueG [Proteiniphilum sp.]